MDFGVSFLPDAAPSTKSAANYFSDALDLAVLADRAGFRTVKMTEHYLHPYGGYCPSPLTFLASVAARTEQIRLMTGCVLPAFHSPVQLAAETAMVDALSNGRLEVGFARAYLPYEFEAFGVDLDDSRRLYRDTINAVVRLWTETDVDLTPAFAGVRKATSLPRPTQLPHPPVWGAAVMSSSSFEWIAEQGYNLLVTSSFVAPEQLLDKIQLYRKTYQDAHGSEVPGRVALSLPLFVSNTAGQATAVADHYLDRYLNVWASAASAWDDRSSRDYPEYTGMSAAIRATSGPRLRALGAAVVGTPDRVREQTMALADDLGVDDVLWQVDFGAMPGLLALSSLQLFVDHVLPSMA